MKDKKELKKIMTNLAAGHITKEEADLCMDIDEVCDKKPKQKQKILKRDQLNSREVK